LYFGAGLFLGWALGANDSANIFGTAVTSGMVKYTTAVILAALFIITGAILQGGEGMETISGLTPPSLNTALLITLAAALTVTVMTVWKLPVSTSQAVVGAIVGTGLMQGSLHTAALTRVFICWVTTPLGAFLVSIISYIVLRKVFQLLRPSMISEDFIYRAGLLAAGCYGAYALGANNVANVTGVFTGQESGMLALGPALLLGGLSIALGVLTFSKNVMTTVGRAIVKINPFAALIVMLAQAVTVHFYALVGVPVSTSQAVVGAVLGISFIKGLQTLNFPLTGKIFLGWITTPVAAGLLAAAMFYLGRTWLA